MEDRSDAGGDVPIACSLSADDYAARLDEIQAIGRRGLLRVERRSDAPDLIFRADPHIRGALERVIDPESADPVMRDLLDRFGLNEAPTT